MYVFALSHISIRLQAPLNAPPGRHSDIDSTQHNTHTLESTSLGPPATSQTWICIQY
jgi:hypothetical protein